jgi:hypothetical protein
MTDLKKIWDRHDAASCVELNPYRLKNENSLHAWRLGAINKVSFNRNVLKYENASRSSNRNGTEQHAWRD